MGRCDPPDRSADHGAGVVPRRVCGAQLHGSFERSSSNASVSSTTQTQPNESVPAMPACEEGVSAFDVVSRWICDTGAARDLVSRNVAKHHANAFLDTKPVKFATANCSYETNKVLAMDTPGLGSVGAKSSPPGCDQVLLLHAVRLSLS